MKVNQIWKGYDQDIYRKIISFDTSKVFYEIIYGKNIIYKERFSQNTIWECSLEYFCKHNTMYAADEKSFNNLMMIKNIIE